MSFGRFYGLASQVPITTATGEFPLPGLPQCGLILDALTFHGEAPCPPLSELFNDDPRGERLTSERCKDLLRR